MRYRVLDNIYKFIAVAIAGISVVAFCGYIWFGLCSNTVLQEVVSSDGRYKAVVFTRDCGATTGFVTRVSILPVGARLPNDGGNVFVVEDGYSPALSGSKPKVLLKWLGKQHLKIVYQAGERVFRDEKKYQNIAISYEKR